MKERTNNTRTSPNQTHLSSSSSPPFASLAASALLATHTTHSYYSIQRPWCAVDLLLAGAHKRSVTTSSDREITTAAPLATLTAAQQPNASPSRGRKTISSGTADSWLFVCLHLCDPLVLQRAPSTRRISPRGLVLAFRPLRVAFAVLRLVSSSSCSCLSRAWRGAVPAAEQWCDAAAAAG